MFKGMRVNINNLDADHERFVVARLVDNQLWYWGSWSDRNEANKVAESFENGVMVDMEYEKK